MQDKNAARIHPATNDPLPTNMLSGRAFWNLLKFKVRVAAGKIFTLAGIPGLVRNCEYHASVTDATVQVRVNDIYTVISVNGLDIYFHRLTGAIDGVGFNPTSDCKPGRAPELAHPVEQHAGGRAQLRTGTR